MKKPKFDGIIEGGRERREEVRNKFRGEIDTHTHTHTNVSTSKSNFLKQQQLEMWLPAKGLIKALLKSEGNLEPISHF